MLEGNRFLAQGSSAEVWRLGEHTVVKLFKPGVHHTLVEREYATALLAHEAGLRVARPLQRETRQDRMAIIYPFIAGESLMDKLTRKPRATLLTLRKLALLHAAIHQKLAGDGQLRSQLDVMVTNILHGPAPEQLKRALINSLALRPAGDRLCHGDFHPGNVIDAPEGLTTVDWVKASAGHAAADVARTELLIRFAPVSGRLSRLFLVRLGRWVAAKYYLHCYLRHTGMHAADVEAWRLPVAVAWLRSRQGKPGDEFEQYVTELSRK